VTSQGRLPGPQGRDILLGAGLPSVTSMAGGMDDRAAASYPSASGNWPIPVGGLDRAPSDEEP
jgi:hypothetical protein